MDDRQLQTHKLETQWCRVCSRLKAEIGDSAYENWVKPLKVSQLEGSEVNLAVPSRFMRDWILANYLDRLRELWRRKCGGAISCSLNSANHSTYQDG